MKEGKSKEKSKCIGLEEEILLVVIGIELCFAVISIVLLQPLAAIIQCLSLLFSVLSNKRGNLILSGISGVLHLACTAIFLCASIPDVKIFRDELNVSSLRSIFIWQTVANFCFVLVEAIRCKRIYIQYRHPNVALNLSMASTILFSSKVIKENDEENPAHVEPKTAEVDHLTKRELALSLSSEVVSEAPTIEKVIIPENHSDMEQIKNNQHGVNNIWIARNTLPIGRPLDLQSISNQPVNGTQGDYAPSRILASFPQQKIRDMLKSVIPSPSSLLLSKITSLMESGTDLAPKETPQEIVHPEEEKSWKNSNDAYNQLLKENKATSQAVSSIAPFLYNVNVDEFPAPAISSHEVELEISPVENQSEASNAEDIVLLQEPSYASESAVIVDNASSHSRVPDNLEHEENNLDGEKGSQYDNHEENRIIDGLVDEDAQEDQIAQHIDVGVSVRRDIAVEQTCDQFPKICNASENSPRFSQISLLLPQSRSRSPSLACPTNEEYLHSRLSISSSLKIGNDYNELGMKSDDQIRVHGSIQKETQSSNELERSLPNNTLDRSGSTHRLPASRKVQNTTSLREPSNYDTLSDCKRPSLYQRTEVTEECGERL